METCVLAAEVYARQEKPLMLLKVIKMAMEMDAENDHVRLASIRLLHMQSTSTSIPQPVKDALAKRESMEGGWGGVVRLTEVGLFRIYGGNLVTARNEFTNCFALLRRSLATRAWRKAQCRGPFERAGGPQERYVRAAAVASARARVTSPRMRSFFGSVALLRVCPFAP